MALSGRMGCLLYACYRRRCTLAAFMDKQFFLANGAILQEYGAGVLFYPVALSVTRKAESQVSTSLFPQWLQVVSSGSAKFGQAKHHRVIDRMQLNLAASVLRFAWASLFHRA